MRALLTMTLLLSTSLMAEEHKHDFNQDVDAFHTVLAPLWHAKADAKRQQDTCAALPSMQTMADKMHYPSAAKLSASIVALQKQCGGELSAFNGGFSQLHDAFHLVAKEK